MGVGFETRSAHQLDREVVRVSRSAGNENTGQETRATKLPMNEA
jgi:hypothetical protein